MVAAAVMDTSMVSITTVAAVDYHTGGEPFRIVEQVPDLAGGTVAAKRVAAVNDPDIDGLRRFLCFEPRGHADMYGGFLVPPDDDGAHLGVLFWHKGLLDPRAGVAVGAGALCGGYVAARIAQRVNAELLRRAIVGLGAILAVWFALRVFL